MSWDLFGWFAAVSLCLWGFGALTAWKGKSMGWVLGPTLAGVCLFFFLFAWRHTLSFFSMIQVVSQ